MNAILGMILATTSSTSFGSSGFTIAGHTITTKTLAGWALGIVLVLLAVNCVGTIMAAKKEHDAGERNEKVKYAVIVMVVGIAVVALLDAIGLISFTDISNGFNSI